MRIPIATILLVLIIAAPGSAGDAESARLRVATRLVKPFVFEDRGKLSGFSVDLWQQISQHLGVQSEFMITGTVKDLLAAVQSNQAHVGIAAVSITAEREKTFDFSHPMFDAGLQIMALEEPVSGGAIGNLLAGLFSAAFLPVAGLILLAILIPAHLIWFFERRRQGGLLPTRAYFPGIFEACWWSAATLATQADQMPRSAAARIVAVVWMFTSVVFIAYFTASVTSSLTLQQLKSDIKGPEDLPGRRVATVTASTSADYLRQHNAQLLEFPKIEEAYKALLEGQADAVVYDAPVLLYFAAHEGKGRAQVVGSIFRKESYGIVFPNNSPHRKRVNEALLSLRENGTYQTLYAKWFGEKNGGA